MQWLNLAGVRLEYLRIAPRDPGRPTIVMLHEGLGSVAAWKDFPAALHRATGSAILAYSRRGYGGSDALSDPRSVDYLHDEALEVLPALLDALGVESPVLFGHSDGASIALIHAGASGRDVAGVIALAPHVMVEEITLRGIAATRRAWETTDLRARLARYHADVEGAFRGWSEAWLAEEFRGWNIEGLLADIACPILAVQGEDDEYATLEQLARIARGARAVTVRVLAACGHSPHRDQPAQLLEAVAHWLPGALSSASCGPGARRDPHA